MSAIRVLLFRRCGDGVSTDVIAHLNGATAHLTLNRPAALHALNTAMCLAMIEALIKWRADDAVRAIVIEHDPDTRGFCAGGDIRMIAESGVRDGVAARAFFHAEYRLNHLLFGYPKPVVVLMDGITMGGGVGLAMPARARIATERTVFAMPEAGIGLFPDVGGGWHLPRLPGEIGMWLALTGARLKAGDCAIAGIATHYIDGDLKRRILDGLRDGDLSDAITPPPPSELTPENCLRIDRLFAGESVEAIFAALETDNSDWARAQLATLRTKSPQTLKVAFRQLREGRSVASFAEEMKREYRIAARVVMRNDFREGVRALIVEKDNAPRWSPDALAGVTDAMLDEIFAPLPQNEEWTPLPGTDA